MSSTPSTYLVRIYCVHQLIRVLTLATREVVMWVKSPAERNLKMATRAEGASDKRLGRLMKRRNHPTRTIKWTARTQKMSADWLPSALLSDFQQSRFDCRCPADRQRCNSPTCYVQRCRRWRFFVSLRHRLSVTSLHFSSFHWRPGAAVRWRPGAGAKLADAKEVNETCIIIWLTLQECHNS